MVSVWLNPSGNKADLTNEVGAKAAALAVAAEQGRKFLALPIENSRDAATWILASFHSAVTVVPLPPALPLPALEARLSQLPPGEVVFPGALSFSKPDGAPPVLRPLEETWAVIFTSGTSGEPKGIALQGSALKQSALAHAEHSGAGDACWLLDLPLYHVGGLSILSRALFLGAPFALGPSRFDAAGTSAWINSGLVQGLSLVPTTLFRLLKETSVDFAKLRLILLGGAAADPELLTAAKTRGAPIRLTYGMTEHCSQIASEKEPGAGLEPLPGVELRFDPDGEVLVRSSALAAGFYRGGSKHVLPLLNGFFATGDLGEFQDGRLNLHGRKSDLIITGGMKVFPLEIEREIARIPGVLDCAVTSAPDPEWGEILCAAITERSPGEFDQSLVREALARNLEPRKIPRRWSIVTSIPRTATGKIQRAELRRLVDPSTPTRS